MLVPKLQILLLAVTMAVVPQVPLAAAAINEPGAATPTSSAESGAVLGLEAEDAAAGAALTEALRRAFSRRGLAYAGHKLSFAEVKLTMGCGADPTECLVQAGRSLGVERVVFGSLQPTVDGGFSLEMTALNVARAETQTTIKTPLTQQALHPDTVDATATTVVSGLFPVPHVSGVTLPVPASPEVESAAVQNDRRAAAGGSSELVWGRYHPRPAWKWVGFGVSVGIATLAGAAVLGSGIALLDSENAPLRKNLLAAADASLTDPNSSNDINTGLIPDNHNICSYARERPMHDPRPHAVRNASVTRVCNQADSIELLQRASIGIGAAALVSTVVFTTLLFVHRRDRDGARAQRLQWGAMPRPGGFSVGGAWRF